MGRHEKWRLNCFLWVLTLLLPSLKLTANAPENGGLQDLVTSSFWDGETWLVAGAMLLVSGKCITLLHQPPTNMSFGRKKSAQNWAWMHPCWRYLKGYET